eukprot:GILJ01018652.1.p1 GENE.GILJ01018652.1~~GILJ01018652.1.p1  ORF type:complete len:237 (-),score=27.88 GILJ01018652.1:41-718(-)
MVRVDCLTKTQAFSVKHHAAKLKKRLAETQQELGQHKQRLEMVALRFEHFFGSIQSCFKSPTSPSSKSPRVIQDADAASEVKEREDFDALIENELVYCATNEDDTTYTEVGGCKKGETVAPHEEETADEDECKICLMPKVDAGMVTPLFSVACGHSFHLTCLAKCIEARAIRKVCTICLTLLGADDVECILRAMKAHKTKTKRKHKLICQVLESKLGKPERQYSS